MERIKDFSVSKFSDFLVELYCDVINIQFLLVISRYCNEHMSRMKEIELGDIVLIYYQILIIDI